MTEVIYYLAAELFPVGDKDFDERQWKQTKIPEMHSESEIYIHQTVALYECKVNTVQFFGHLYSL